MYNFKKPLQFRSTNQFVTPTTERCRPLLIAPPSDMEMENSLLKKTNILLLQENQRLSSELDALKIQCFNAGVASRPLEFRKKAVHSPRQRLVKCCETCYERMDLRTPSSAYSRASSRESKLGDTDCTLKKEIDQEISRLRAFRRDLGER